MLHFGNPAALWLLSLIVPLIVLYLLKHRKQDKIVPSLLLWKQAVEDFRAQTPFQKLRTNLLLLLQILILVLLTALLSEPYLAYASQQSTRWILVLDCSASMKATDESPSRFAVAKSHLLKALDAVSPVDEVMFIALSSEPKVLQSFSRNHSATRSHIGSSQPQDLGENWNQLSKILEPLVRQKPRPRIVIASDFAKFPQNLQNQISFEGIAVGKSGENLAITKIALEPVVQNLQTQILFLEVRNLGKEDRTADLEIRKEDELMDAFELKIGPSQSIQKSISVEVNKLMRLSVSLNARDFLTIDNDFVVQAKPREKVRVQLKSQNPFLIKAIDALPSIAISQDSPIIIGNAETISNEAGIFFLRGNANSPAEIIQWNTTHPLLRFIDAALWRFSATSILEVHDGAEILLETKDGPIGYALEEQSKRRIVLGFLLEESNLPELAGFPIFLQNATNWISEPLRKAAPMKTDRERTQEGPFMMDQIGGFANFLDPEESNIQPGQAPALNKAEARLISIRKDASFWFLLSLISVVMLEWWAFHQKYEV